MERIYKVGHKVRFAESTGNDTTAIHTISGVLPQDESTQTFYTLEGDKGGLYLASSLVPAEESAPAALAPSSRLAVGKSTAKKPGPAKYILKAGAIEARQHLGPGSIIVNSIRKGEQQVRPGDFLLTDQEVVDKAKVAYDENAAQHPEIDWDHVDNAFRAPRGSVYKMTKDEFFKIYELADGAEAGDVQLYNVPHFDTTEAAQQAAAVPTPGVQGTAFRCTIGDSDNLYSITNDGIITQVPAVQPDPNADPGYGFEDGARDERQPVALQNEGVHETLPASPDQTPLVS